MRISPESSHEHNLSLSRHWLLLALCALASAGLFALPPVILRGPYFENILPTKLIFATSLILHVNLSVLVWILAIAGSVWSLAARPRFYLLYRMIAWTATIGMVLMVSSAFLGNPMPVENNYVPMLQNLPFIIGLSLFGAAIFFQVLLVLALHFHHAMHNPLHFGMYAAAFIILLSFIGFAISSHMIDAFDDLGAHAFYERFYWAGGHVLQLAYATLMVVAWLWNSGERDTHSPFPSRLIKLLFAFNVLLAIPAPFMQLQYDDLYSSIDYFTKHMRDADGIVAAIIGITLFWQLLKHVSKEQLRSPVYVCTVFSILLFGIGGMLGFMITQVNTVIPAHYHGSIVAITLAGMGLAYHLLPALGYGKPEGKIAIIQPWIYSAGQTMHVSGLALMGGYGALRKAPGTSPQIHTMLGKTMFFSGGALAILGGLLFIIVAYQCVFRKKVR